MVEASHCLESGRAYECIGVILFSADMCIGVVDAILYQPVTLPIM